MESVPDARLIKRVKYPDEDYDDKTAISELQKEILEITNGVSEFIPVTFQYPISVCVAKISENFLIDDIVILDDGKYRTSEITRLFWLGVEKIYDEASLVTFNGRGFDIPILELMAYRYGLTAKRHFKDKFAGRYRFGTKHIDLQDWLSNYNAIKMAGGLNLLAKILGKPGKMSTKGDEVYDMFLEGKIKEINDYCVHDVLDTYFVFLRTRVMLGELTVEREQDIIGAAKEFIKNNLERIPALVEYWENWGDWEPWP